jgi:hypothetical protein
MRTYIHVHTYNKSMNTVLLITLVIIIFIVVIYLLRRKSATELYKESNGTADAPAIAALGALDRARTPHDRFIRAQIHLYNILHDDNFNQNMRRAVLHDVADDYYNVLTGLYERRDGAQLGPTTGIFGGNVNQPDIEFMLFEIGAFNDMYQPGVLFEDLLDNTTEVTTPSTINERKTAAIAAASKPTEAIDNYFKSSSVYTDNPQNVHDSGVNSDLRLTLSKIRSYEPEAPSPADAINEAITFIGTKYSGRGSIKAQHALSVLNERVAHGGSIDTFNDTEDRIFASVWARTNTPQNALNADKMREAIIDSLADCYDNDSIVCINGRTARVINSLVTLDSDETISAGAMTKEAYRNQIFTEARDIISREIAVAKESADPTLAAVGKYFDGQLDINEDDKEANRDLLTAREKFIKDVKSEIDQNLKQYNSTFRSEELQKIANECYAGIDF